MDPAIATSIALSGFPARYSEIDQVEAWYYGHQYEVSGAWYREHPWGREFDSTGRYIPLAERRPYDQGIARALVDKTTSFLFDEGRFPQVLVDGDGPDAIAAQAWARAILGHCRARVKMLEAARLGGRCRSVWVYFKVVDGEPSITSHSGKVCTPTFARDGKTVLSVRKQYKSTGAALETLGYEGLDAAKLYWYRVDFTTEAELVYLPVEVTVGPIAPTFTVDEARSFHHNLGFVPGVWMVNQHRSEESYDGLATYEGDQVLGLMHLVNEAMSGAHRAVRNACDPQWAMEYDPNGEVDVSGLRNQTKGGLWTIPGVLKLHEATGSGAQAARDQSDTYKAAIANTTGIAEVDPESIASKAQSAEALRVLYQSLIAFVSILRTSYGDDGLVPLVQVILRVLRAIPAGDTLSVEAFDHEGKAVSRDALAERPRVKLEWGPWFAPTALDDQAAIAAVATAVGSSLLSQETGVAVVAARYGRDSEEELRLVLAEQAQKAEQAMRDQVAIAEAMDGLGSDQGG